MTTRRTRLAFAAIVVSPWTAGGLVSSEPLDHTSCLRFLERVTGVTEPNISDWRRATFGDFTAALQQAPAAAPSIPAASPSATAAQLAYQTQQSALPLPGFPGTLQTAPVRQGGPRPPAG